MGSHAAIACNTLNTHSKLIFKATRYEQRHFR